MGELIAIAVLFGGGITFIVLRLSIALMFWFSDKPNDKKHVFRNQFPYYMMVLSILIITIIIALDFAYFAMYYFTSVYFIALFIWNFKLKHCKRKYHSVEPSHPNLP
ncbi:hypothetical protein [Winogradskyella endarachnes]|uniref:Uncharacterized protein n=1 Tax=Winogradskyella endarachnes TaxID=2681965 RepID=A0A6L6UBJ8_9FLAO|nr:hypothetical protein [Winogradskyella endarachnes]MUU79670.1 hypothetical protein [Winogradskyella endarachnes]